MTDYFAVLDRPRRPWLEPDALKQTFHARTLQAHPDAHVDDTGAPSDTAFAQLNEAYQVLRDPKRRLQHFLNLEGAALSGPSAAIPPEMEEVFPQVAALMREADAALQKAGTATSALSRSLATPELLAALQTVDGMLKRLEELHRYATIRLREADERWRSEPASELPELQRLYLQFSYVSRWRDELAEKRARLSGAI